MSDKSKAPTDSTWHRIEELRHQRHAEIRAAHLHGDGTIEAGEQELARIKFLKFCREQEARDRKNAERRLQEEIRDALRDALEQKQEAAK